MLALVRVKPLGLMLFDAKTRPKHIVPGDEAAKRLESLAHSTSGNRKLPGEHGEGPLCDGASYWFSTNARDTACIVLDARLTDLSLRVCISTIQQRDPRTSVCYGDGNARNIRRGAASTH